MLTLLLGPDDYSKREYIDSKAQELGLAIELFVDAENPPQVENLASFDLFSKPKAFILKGLIAKFREPNVVETLKNSKNYIFFIEDKIDKRSSENKTLLSNKGLEILDYQLPHGVELNTWIKNRVVGLGGAITNIAVEELAVRVGRDNAKETKVGGKLVAVEEAYNLNQLDSEIQKLLVYKNKTEIKPEDVKEMVLENFETDAFALTNAIADGKKQVAIELLNSFLKGQSGADEKGSIIQLNALLSEQFRNIVMVQDFLKNKLSEEAILEKTGWKSGRLFVMKKIVGRFETKKVLETLVKLEALDEELKSSQIPPRTLLDLILTQLF